MSKIHDHLSDKDFLSKNENMKVFNSTYTTIDTLCDKICTSDIFAVEIIKNKAVSKEEISNIVNSNFEMIEGIITNLVNTTINELKK